MEGKDITWALIVVTITLIVYTYSKIKRSYNYWSKKSVAHPKPLPLIGNLLPVALQKESLGNLYKNVYFKYPNEKVIGIYEAMNPVLIVKDPQLLERILVKDFNHFVDHGDVLSEGLFGNGLFQIKGPKWRSLRYNMSPAFTSGKLKIMFNDMAECTEVMLNLIKNNLHKDYEVQDALMEFTIDVIAHTVFGIEINDVEAREEFATRGKSIFNLTYFGFFKLFLIIQFPKVAKMIGLKSMIPETEKYFRNIIKNTFEQRLKGQNQERNDYLNHLIKLKEKGVIGIQSKNFIEEQGKDEDDDFLDLGATPPQETFEITEEILAGQAFQFLTAGFDPLFNTMMYVMFDMARFPETQELARQEIKQVLENEGGFTYKALKEMTYLEQCIQESSRLHTLNPFLLRSCTKNYKTYFGLEIEKGQRIVIPLSAMHMDPKYFPDPETYIPERHPPNTIKSNFTYLPFGDGPRMCIGIRFAMVEIKLGLAKIIDSFKFTLSPKTKLPLEIDKRSFILLPTHKVKFILTPV